jgi:cytochrome c peroxidase
LTLAGATDPGDAACGGPEADPRIVAVGMMRPLESAAAETGEVRCYAGLTIRLGGAMSGCRFHVLSWTRVVDQAFRGLDQSTPEKPWPRGFTLQPDWGGGPRIRLRLALARLALMTVLAGISSPTFAQNPQAAVLAGETAHAREMKRLFPDAQRGTQATPRLIPKLEIDPDPSGAIATVQPNGPTITAKSAFFANLGANGRTCFTCHQPQDGWTVSAAHARDRFAADSNDPLFRLVDGATCPSDDVSTPRAKQNAYSLLLDKGLIRIGLPMPSGAQFQILSVSDPYDCNTNPTTGLTSSSTGIVSVYRRPLPSTNLGFLSTIMWDGREPSLFSQAVDATLTHAQAAAAPSPAQQQQIVTFEGCTYADTPPAASCATTPHGSGVFTAYDGAAGGPETLYQELANFYIGINDPLGGNPAEEPFTPVVFSLYDAWSNLHGHSPAVAAREAIAHGEQVFNTTKINITGVAGLNDALNQPSIAGFCGTCHDTPAAGDHSVKAPLNIGIASAGTNSPPALDITGLPVFTIWCISGPLAGQMFEVTDPGRALITGKCADIGKLKGPVLRGLAARAPYFHNGSAASLQDVVEFYDQRFSIGLSKQDKADLVVFLNSL